MTDILHVAGLRAGYGPVEVLHGIDLSVQAGEIVVVLGANGAGKTTTMRAISGTIPRRGSVIFDGREISHATGDAVVRAGIAQVPQGRGTFVDLTVEDNLRVGGFTRRDGGVNDDVARWLDTFPRLKERRTQKAGSLSGGEQQMLAIARALMSKPTLLLCDEPSLGLAPLITQELFRMLTALNTEQGTSILLVEQNANLAVDIAHRVYVLETGTIAASGDAATIRDDESIRKAYLGYYELTVARFLQYVFNGLSSGAIYSLLALGLVIVYRGSGHLNFAQGEMAMASAFFAWWYSGHLPIWIAVLAAAVTGFVLAAAIERVIIRPIGEKSQFAVVVASIGLFLGINSLVPFAWKVTNPQPFESLFPNKSDDFMRIGGATWRYQYMGILLVTLIVAALLIALFQKTKLGLSMRAVASNPESSPLVGIKTGQVLMVSWGLAAFVGAIGGAMVASLNGNVNAAMMFTVFFSAAAAATLGGFDSVGGAVIAGLSLGVIENMTAGYQPDVIGQELRFGVSLIIILVVLLVKPSGLFGSQRVERV